jgi:hypothetical protein
MLGSQTGTWCVSQSLVHSLSRRQRKHGFLHTRTSTTAKESSWSLRYPRVGIGVATWPRRQKSGGGALRYRASVTCLHQVVIAVGLVFFWRIFAICPVGGAEWGRGRGLRSERLRGSCFCHRQNATTDVTEFF